MTATTIADALRLAINVLEDVSESQRLPAGTELGRDASQLHGDAAETLRTFLADLKDFD